jgi:hypothetical protein
MAEQRGHHSVVLMALQRAVQKALLKAQRMEVQKEWWKE